MKPVSRIVFIYAVDLGYNTHFGFRMDRTLPPPGGRGLRAHCRQILC
jgi:hypothetical protein